MHSVGTLRRKQHLGLLVAIADRKNKIAERLRLGKLLKLLQCFSVRRDRFFFSLPIEVFNRRDCKVLVEERLKLLRRVRIDPEVLLVLPIDLDSVQSQGQMAMLADALLQALAAELGHE